MASIFHLKILTPEKKIYEQDVESLTAPGIAGYFGVLKDHAPFIAGIGLGKIVIKEQGGSTKEFDSKAKGFFQVLKNNATLLLEAESTSA